jgi:uncharacterized Fe-S cluster protein YjdI
MEARFDKPAREYANDEIVVEWQPRLCFHARECIKALPAVFDAERRPWIDVDAASADEVEAAVALCPSGALRSRRLGAAVSAQATEETTITLLKDGPLLVRGNVRILDADANEVAVLDRAALCRCGGSKNKPFCDGTHRTNGFTG